MVTSPSRIPVASVSSATVDGPRYSRWPLTISAAAESRSRGAAAIGE